MHGVHSVQRHTSDHLLNDVTGGCVYKGFNRAVATATAGVLALGVHWIASKSGDTFQLFIRSGSVFLLGTYTYT
jgi:hypothetical protein